MDNNDTKIKFDKEDARAQLASLQQLRTHWSGVITNHLGLALTINVAIISYFLKSYIDSINSSMPQYTLLFALAALTSLLFGLWRLYAHYIDNSIANLYPDFLKCEYLIGLKENEGTMKYLLREIKRAQNKLDEKNLSHVDKIQFFSELVEKKRINPRGHRSIDMFTLIIQVTILIGTLIVSWGSLTNFDLGLSILALLGIVLTIISIFRFQKSTREKDINYVLNKI